MGFNKDFIQTYITLYTDIGIYKGTIERKEIFRTIDCLNNPSLLIKNVYTIERKLPPNLIIINNATKKMFNYSTEKIGDVYVNLDEILFAFDNEVQLGDGYERKINKQKSGNPDNIIVSIGTYPYAYFLLEGQTYFLKNRRSPTICENNFFAMTNVNLKHIKREGTFDINGLPFVAVNSKKYKSIEFANP